MCTLGEKMKPDILLMGICHPGKLAYLNQSLDSVDPIQTLFNKKILAVDQFNGHVFPQPFKKKFSAKDWTILIDSHRSRPKSVLHALNTAESDWVFYTEDDILLEIPVDFDLSKFDKNIDGKELGMLSLNFGGTELDLTKNDVGDIAFAEQNMIYSDDKLICFKRIEETNDGHFFEFPGVFVRKSIFKECLLHAMEFHKRAQIERALTFSWFDLEMGKKYYKASVLKKEVLDYRENNAIEILHNGRFFKTIDPLQGHFAYGGDTHI